MNRKQRLTWLTSRQNKSLFNPKHRITVELQNNDKRKKIYRPKSSLNKVHQNLNLHGSLDLKHVDNTASVLRNLDKNTLAVIRVNDVKPETGRILSSKDIQDLLKEVTVSPNPKIENADVKTAARRNLVCVLSWLEVELVSDTQVD